MEFIKGMDLSSIKEVEACGAKFYDKGKEKDVFEILKNYGTNSVRLRLWNDPYSIEGKPYGAGNNDLNTTIELAKRAIAHGMGVLLDFHYSDFWADPGKQTKPKAWKNYNDDELERAVYEYTLYVMKAMKEQNAYPSLVQIGNELSNGLLWPEGKVPNYENIARFVSAGICAVRSVDDSMPIMIHLDNGGNNALYREWFDNFMKYGEDFDIIGLSYYPFWHGSMEDLSNNMNDIARRYGKSLVIAEVSMGYTTKDYAEYEKLSPTKRKGMATKPELLEKIEYPMTQKGQADFMLDILKRLKQVPNGLGRGFYYWEPAWIPVPGSEWAKPEALSYINEGGPGGNEWANQALFDYDGNALRTLETIRDWKE